MQVLNRQRPGNEPSARWRKTLLFAVLAQLCGTAAAQAAEPAQPLAEAATPDADRGLYWHPNDLGSESQFNPLTAWLNASFDILRNPSYQDSLTGIDYQAGAVNVWRNVTQPGDAGSHFGWNQFVAHEIFPVRGFDRQYGQFIPNWTMHALGEGMLYRKLDDWYAFHDVRHPRLLALLTMVAIEFTNEVTENGSFRGPNQDPIADMLIWNPLGLVLFSIDPVARFFRGPVTLDFWPGQPVLANGMRLANQGENYAFKVKLGLPFDARFFAYIGKEGLAGASVPVSAHDHVSVAVGASLNRLEQVATGDGTARVMNADGSLVVETAVFWDRDESLLMSLVAGLTYQPSLHLNVYPGLWAWNGWAFGGFARWASGEGASAGLTLRGSPLGLGWIQAANDHPAAFLH